MPGISKGQALPEERLENPTALERDYDIILRLLGIVTLQVDVSDVQHSNKVQANQFLSKVNCDVQYTPVIIDMIRVFAVDGNLSEL